eukprot:gene28302-35142_t
MVVPSRWWCASCNLTPLVVRERAPYRRNVMPSSMIAQPSLHISRQDAFNGAKLQPGERRVILGWFALQHTSPERNPARMPHDIPLITTIAAALGFGLIFGFIATRMKLPALVGYLAAGILIGPATPGFAADTVLAGQLAEIGVMLNWPSQ